MSINHLSVARIAGEVGLGIGTVTGAACAGDYAGKITEYKHQLEINDIKKNGRDDEIKARTRDWILWVQYGVSCMNSINNKGTIEDSIKSNADEVVKKAKAATEEALACKNHMLKAIKNKRKITEIDWSHRSPSQTEANKEPTSDS